MKKVLLLLTIVMTTILPSYSLEEVELELPKEPNNLDYLSNVYYGKVKEDESVSPFFKLFSEKGLEFENSNFINSVKFSLLFDSRLNLTIPQSASSSLVHDFNTIEPMISAKFNENKSEIMFDYNILRNLEGYSNHFTEKISRFYISHEISDNNKIFIGQADRLPSTFDGALGTMGQNMVLRSQIGRTFGDVRSVGIRDIGSYKYVEYDLGIYDSTRYMKDFGNGVDFSGKLAFKPLANIREKSGDLKIGGTYSIGKNNISYNVFSFYTSYDYKKFHIISEIAQADGYNGIQESHNNAEGFYTLFMYDLTDKVSLRARYDYFIPNSYYNNSYIQEYTAGITYKAFKNLKFMLNYVNRNHSNRPDSNMILFATRFFI